MTRIIEESELARLLAEAREPKWRPINTAPKDGTVVLLANGSGVWTGKYKPVYQSGFAPATTWFSLMLNHDHIGNKSCTPTHWMPLPEAPKGRKMKSEQRSVLSRDMQIAEAVQEAIVDACDAAAREWLKHGFPAEKNAAVACVGLANRIGLPAIIASVPAPEPIAYLIERHVFRASQDGQDAEGLDWLEIAEIGDAGSFPVYAAPPAASSGANEVATINRQLLDALKRAKWIIDMYAQVVWYLNGNEASKTLIDDAISAAEKEMGKC